MDRTYIGITQCAVENLPLTPTLSRWERVGVASGHLDLFPWAVVFDARKHEVGGVNVKTVAVVNLFDEALDERVIERQSTAGTRALQMMVV